jgi:RHS repeat-associated protein
MKTSIRSIFGVALAFTAGAFANLSRHNEQGLSPTHSYSIGGPEEAISNLNGNLVIKTIAAQVGSVPLPIRVERTFNSHWRSPLVVHQFDLDYDKADEKKTDDDGNESWKIEFDDHEGIPADRLSSAEQLILRRAGFSVREMDDQIRGFAWMAGMTSMIYSPVEKVIRSANQIDIGPLGTVSKAPNLDQGLRWGSVGLSAMSLGLQLTSIDAERFGWNEGGSWEYTAVTLGGLTYSAGNLLVGMNLISPTSSFGQYLPVLGLALSLYSLSTLDPSMPGYEAQVVASFAGIGYSMAALAGVATPGIGLAVLAIQLGALWISEYEADQMRWETADYGVPPWPIAVNGYVSMVGNKFQEDLTRDSRATGRPLVYQNVTYSTKPTEFSRGSMHPMPEMSLVRGDGGAERFILADREPSLIDDPGQSDTLWYSYTALSNTNKSHVFYADVYPFTKDASGTTTPSQPEDFYLIKEPDGTWATFGGNAGGRHTKGIYKESGRTQEVFWALPNAVGVFGPSGTKMDSIRILRDSLLRPIEVRHSVDPRWVSITYVANDDIIVTHGPEGKLDEVRYGITNHPFDDGHGSTIMVNGLPKYVPDGLVRMVSSVKRDKGDGAWQETRYTYKAGNVKTITRPTGAVVEYTFDSARSRSVYDGFCHLRSERSPNGTTREWRYAYRGWGDRANGVREDGGIYLYTTVTRALTAVDGPGAGGTSDPVTSSTTEVYRFSAAMDGINIRHAPGHNPRATVLPRSEDGLKERAMEYRSARLQLSTEILGAEDQGKRTDYVYEGDRMVKKMERLGRDTGLAPVITIYDYDGQGNLVGERINPQEEMDQFELGLLLSQSSISRDSLLTGGKALEDLNLSSLRASYRNKTGRSFDESVRLEVLDKSTIFLIRTEDSSEFWKDSLVPSLNPRRVDDSAHWVNYPREIRRKANLIQNIAGGVSAYKQREADERVAKMVADSTAQAHMWRSMPESALVIHRVRNLVFNPWRRYLSGMRVGSFATRKHPDTASTGNGLYGEVKIFDSTYLRPQATFWFINGWVVPNQTFHYNGANPWVPTGTTTYLGWVVDDAGKFDTKQYRMRYDSVVLDGTYHLWPTESHSWTTPQIGLTAQHPGGEGDLISRKNYDSRGRVIEEIAPNDAVVKTKYDGLDRVVRVDLPDGSHRGTKYEDVAGANGRIRQIDTTESGRIQVTEYDALGRMLEERSHSRNGNLVSKTRYSLGVTDKIIWTQDPDGRETHRTYDGLGRLLSSRVKKSGLGWYERTYLWNDRDRILTERDALGRATEFRYNIYGQDIEVRRLVGDGTTYLARYQYDSDGNPVVVVAPNGDTTRHQFDWKKQAVHSVYPDDLEVRNMTDWSGVVLGTTSLRRSDTTQRDEIRLTYDALGRKDSVWVIGDSRMSQRYLWDNYDGLADNGRLLALRLGTGVTSNYQYNPMGTTTRRVLFGNAFGQSFSDTISWTVRAGDQARTGVVLPRGAELAYRYDPLDRLGSTSLQDPQNVVHGVLDTVLYLDGGLIDSIRYGSGVGQKIRYDSTRPLLRSMVASRGSLEIHRMEMSYDDEGNIVEQARFNGEKAVFGYDGLNRLKTVRYPTDRTGLGSLRYQYDLNGNRLGYEHEFGSESWGYRTGTNLLESGVSSGRGSRRYQWDARGNLSQETRWATDPGMTADAETGGWLERRAMRWNVRNELERTAVVRDLGGRLDTTVIGMIYGEDGNRVMRAVVESVTGSDTTWRVTNRWVYDGTSVVADSGSTSAWRWHAYNGLSRVAEATDSGASSSSLRYLLTDHLGTVQAITDDTGAVVARYQFDPYGNLESYQGSVTTDLLYTGKGFDADLGYWYFNARFYDAERGAFMGRDPKRDSIWRNPYTYVDNSPLISVDPDGRDKVYLVYINLPWMDKVVKPRIWSHTYVAVATDEGRVLATYSYGADGKSQSPAGSWISPIKDLQDERKLAQIAIDQGDAKMMLKGDGLAKDADVMFGAVESNNSSWYDVGFNNCKQWAYRFLGKIEMRAEFRGGAVEKAGK